MLHVSKPPTRVTLAGTRVALPSNGGEAVSHNVALGYLQAFVEDEADLHVRRVDFTLRLGDAELPDRAVDEVLEGDPELIGISSYCWDADAIGVLVDRVAERSPESVIVLGGATATFAGEEFLRAHPAIRLAVVGEGEETFRELVRGGVHAPASVTGVLYRDGDVIRRTPARPVSKLSALRSPYLSGVMEPPRNQLALEWSRGCVYRCKHCAWKNFLGGLRLGDPAAIVAELGWAVDHGHELAFVLDAAINFDGAWLDEVTQHAARKVARDRLSLAYFLSRDHFREEQLRSLERLGAHEIWLGVESTNRHALAALGRPPFDSAAFEAMLRQLGALGPVHLSVMLGIPGDTLSGFRETIDYLAGLRDRGLPIAAVRVFWTLVPPGSFFHDRREQFGIRTVSRGMPYLLGCSSFPQEDLAEAFRFLFEHPRRELFVYDDPSPGTWLPGCESPGHHSPSRARPQPGAARLPLETWDALVPGCAEGHPFARGWIIRSLFLHEGWPSLRVEKGDRAITLQLRLPESGRTGFCRVGPWELVWLRDGAIVAPDPELPVLARALALAAARRSDA